MQVGLQWMLSLYNNKLNGILADEMGLGKTVQVTGYCINMLVVQNFLVIIFFLGARKKKNFADHYFVAFCHIWFMLWFPLLLNLYTR